LADVELILAAKEMLKAIKGDLDLIFEINTLGDA